MTRIARRLAEQLARPNGHAGQLLGSAMDIANRGPTRLAIDLLAPKDGETVLDAGCGTGEAIRQVLRRADCHAIGIDPSKIMIQRARKRLAGKAAFHQAGLEELSLPQGSIDAALLLNVLYFCDREGQMLANLKRVLKPAGRLVVYVTHRKTMEGWPFAKAGLHRLYDESELVAALAVAGFARNRILVQSVEITRKVTGLLAHAEV